MAARSSTRLETPRGYSTTTRAWAQLHRAHRGKNGITTGISTATSTHLRVAVDEATDRTTCYDGPHLPAPSAVRAVFCSGPARRRRRLTSRAWRFKPPALSADHDDDGTMAPRPRPEGFKSTGQMVTRPDNRIRLRYERHVSRRRDPLQTKFGEFGSGLRERRR